MATVFTTGSGRVWVTKFRAGPTHEPKYLGYGQMAGGADWGQGDVTKIESPSDTTYNEWNEIQSFQSSPDRATLTLTIYETIDRSDLMELVRLRCPFDAEVHQGTCGDPRDFNGGWEKVKVFEDSRVTNYTTSDLGASEGEGQDKVTEETPISSRGIYDILRVTYREVAKNEVGEEVIAVDVCDLVTCGDCEGAGSDGCQKVFAVTNAGATSPGVKPQVIITTDQYGVSAIIERWVTTFAIGENASDAACVGAYFVVLGSTSPGSIHYASTQDMIDEVETWTKVATGFIALKTPNSIWNYSPMTSYIAANGGYVYLMKNPADGVTVLDAGSNTTQNLNEIAGWDSQSVAAVGQAGSFVYTTDGFTFALGTAPTGPTNLNAVAYRRKSEIWVGGDDGILYYTTDFGDHWGSKAIPGGGIQIDKIVWLSDKVGLVAVRTAAPLAKILRTIDGGYSWYVTPESSSHNLPAFDYANDIAYCQKEVNKAFIGGLADNGGDGILIKSGDQ